jgi:hypothetical protein
MASARLCTQRLWTARVRLQHLSKKSLHNPSSILFIYSFLKLTNYIFGIYLTQIHNNNAN